MTIFYLILSYPARPNSYPNPEAEYSDITTVYIAFIFVPD